MAEVDVTREIHAAPIDVWRIVGEFSRAGEWLAGLESFESTGDNPGAVNTLHLGDDRRIVERLVSRDDGGWTLTYEITDSPFPVELLNATLSVSAVGRDRCIVGWRARFEPRAGVPEEQLSGAFRDAFEAGLTNLARLCQP